MSDRNHKNRESKSFSHDYLAVNIRVYGESSITPRLNCAAVIYTSNCIIVALFYMILFVHLSMQIVSFMAMSIASSLLTIGLLAIAAIGTICNADPAGRAACHYVKRDWSMFRRQNNARCPTEVTCRASFRDVSLMETKGRFHERWLTLTVH